MTEEVLILLGDAILNSARSIQQVQWMRQALRCLCRRGKLHMTSLHKQELRLLPRQLREKQN